MSNKLYKDICGKIQGCILGSNPLVSPNKPIPPKLFVNYIGKLSNGLYVYGGRFDSSSRLAHILLAFTTIKQPSTIELKDLDAQCIIVQLILLSKLQDKYTEVDFKKLYLLPPLTTMNSNECNLMMQLEEIKNKKTKWRPNGLFSKSLECIVDSEGQSMVNDSSTTFADLFNDSNSMIMMFN